MDDNQHKQRNWLILITISLVLLLVIILVLQGSNFLNKKDDAPIQTNTQEQKELDSSYESYSTKDLEFSAKYQNSIEKESINEGNVTATNISYKNNVLSILLERESLCTEDKSPASQAGYYIIEGSNLILTTLTNTDASVYTQKCSISNSYKISNIDLSAQTQNGQSFTVYYKSEDGVLHNLNACFYNNHLYAQDAIFSGENNQICECQNGVVVCGDNK